MNTAVREQRRRFCKTAAVRQGNAHTARTRKALGDLSKAKDENY